MKLNAAQLNVFITDFNFACRKHREWRIGQAMYNTLHDLHPELASSIRGTSADPFNIRSTDDPRYQNFFDAISASLENYTKTRVFQALDNAKHNGYYLFKPALHVASDLVMNDSDLEDESPSALVAFVEEWQRKNGEVEDAEDLTARKLHELAHKTFSNLFAQCGNNADWNISAWYVGTNKPNTESGEYYILDHEDGTYGISTRVYKDSDNDLITERIRIDLTDQTLDNGKESIRFLEHVAIYIKHNL